MSISLSLRKAFEERFTFIRYKDKGVCYMDGYTAQDILSFIAEREEEVRAEKEALASALISMYEQYCGNGHDFMSAGEEASTVLEQQGYADFDEVGRMILSREDKQN